MRKLHFSYRMTIDYSEEVARCFFTIKCIPKDSNRQKIENIDIKLIPETDYNFGIDGLKNSQIYGTEAFPHKSFTFSIEGDADTGLSDYETDKDEDLDMVFAHPHGLNLAGKNIKEYYAKQKLDEKLTNYDIAEYFMHKLHEDFLYKPLTTDVNTSAEEAFVQGSGVCQDYAHIFIALMHLAKVPARYVTGLIMGEGASHAWVEILDEGKWYGLDPTNDKIVTDEHIKIGVGRDAKDCMINRGIMHGGGLHIQTVQVNVTERE